MHKKRLMIIGAGWEQAPLVQSAKDLGYWILATHASSDAEGFRYADAVEILNPRDIPAAMELFQKYKIDAVVSDNDDYALYTTGIICQKFGLPGPNFEAISFSNNKKKSRIACEAAGIKQPKFYLCNTLDDLFYGVKYVGGFPVIVKPIDNRGNFGVNRVDGLEDIKYAFFDAIAHSHSKEFLVEKFIEGTLMTVDGFSFTKHRHVSLGVASKKMLEGKRRVAMEIIYPADFDRTMIQKAIKINNRVTRLLNYDFGFTHSEYIVDKEGDIWLVESTNRGGGVYTSSLIIPAITEIDLRKHMIQMAFGEVFVPKIDESNPMKNCAILSFF